MANPETLRQIADRALMLRVSDPRTVSASMLRSAADDIERLRAALHRIGYAQDTPHGRVVGPDLGGCIKIARAALADSGKAPSND